MLIDLELKKVALKSLMVDLEGTRGDYIPVAITLTMTREQAYALLRTTNKVMDKDFHGKVNIAC